MASRPASCFSRVSHDRFVKEKDGPVAYLWVDALRYEIGSELAEALKGVAESVELTAAMVSIPTITPVGMTNLCPGADAGLSIELTPNERLVVKIGDAEIRGVPDRENLLRAAHGEVVNLGLTQLFDQGEKELAKKSDRHGSCSCVRKRWTLLGNRVCWPRRGRASRPSRRLVRAVARLGQAGVRRVVIRPTMGSWS